MNNDQKDDLATLDYLNKDIFELIDAKDIPQEKQDEILNKMLETIQQRVIVRVLDQLSDQDYEKLKEILKSKDEKRFDEFYNKTGLSLVEIYSEESLLYKIEIVNLIKESQKSNKEE